MSEGNCDCPASLHPNMLHREYCASLTGKAVPERCKKHDILFSEKYPCEYCEDAKPALTIGDAIAARAAKSVKDSNPKDAIGSHKVPFGTVPAPVMAEVGLAMLEGALKYGRHNYRAIGVRSSVYYDAAMRHLTLWWEGQDIDPDSKLSHVTKAIAGLIVLRDAMMNEKLSDDRPPPVKNQDWVLEFNLMADEMIKRYPSPKEAYTRERLS